MRPPDLTTSGLVRDLIDSCRITPASVLVVHSSLRAVGRVEGGPLSVVRASVQTAGPKATVLMPTFTDPPPSGLIDLRTAASRTGAITEAFRSLPAARRSRHPTHSVSAWGRQRDTLIEGRAHERPWHG